MKKEDIKNRINEFCTLFGFEYNGKNGDVDHFSENEFNLTFDGETITVHSIAEVMETPFFDGKCLNDICDEINIAEW